MEEEAPPPPGKEEEALEEEPGRLPRGRPPHTEAEDGGTAPGTNQYTVVRGFWDDTYIQYEIKLHILC